MRRLLVPRWLLALAAATLLGFSSASAQVAPSPGSRDIQRGYQGVQSTPHEDAPKTPAFAYLVAVASALIVLVILCTPSRKVPA